MYILLDGGLRDRCPWIQWKVASFYTSGCTLFGTPYFKLVSTEAEYVVFLYVDIEKVKGQKQGR